MFCTKNTKTDSRWLYTFFSLLMVWLGVGFGPPQASGQGFIFTQPSNLVTLNSGQRNNVFYVGQPITFTLAGSAAVRYEVRDYWGNLVDQGPTAATITPKVSQPGWYKLYLHAAVSVATYGDSVGGTMFVIFRNTPGFPALPAQNALLGNPNLYSEDEPMRDVTGMGPQRHYVQDCNNPTQAIADLDPSIAVDKQMYIPFDPVRNRSLLIAFPNGTQNQAGVQTIVSHYQNDVQYWEPRNEPQNTDAATFVQNELIPFYKTVKSVNPSLKVLGPVVVTIGPGMLGWIENFLKAGGANYIDGFSFHAYNNVNGDFWLAHASLDGLNALLAKYGADKLEKWQTEQGYFGPVYGAYEPRHQGRWTMVQMMAFEQYGIPKEHNHLWYDKSHGFWPQPTWWENDDGGLNPVAVLMRVWSEELYGAKFAKAYDFGPTGNKLYSGNLFTGTAKQVAAFMSAGSIDGQITLNVSGSSLHIVSAFGVASDLPVTNGTATLPVPEIPVYVELASGQTLSVAHMDWGPNQALVPGVQVFASGLPQHPLDPNDSNNLNKIVNGVLENWYYTQQSNDRVWMSNVSSFPATVEIDLPAPTPVNHVIIYCPQPWQFDGSLLDYELQYDNNGQWVTINHVQEPSSTFPIYSPTVRCTVDSFYSDRSIFTHQFPTVTTQKIRLLVHDVTWGGGATQDVVNAGGQTGPHQVTLREVEIYSPYNPAQQHTIHGIVTDSKGQGVTGITMTLSGSTSATVNTDAWGKYIFAGLPEGGAFTVTPSSTFFSFSPSSMTISQLEQDQTANFQATLIPAGSGNGLLGQYFQDTGVPFTWSHLVGARVDSTINLNFYGLAGSPPPVSISNGRAVPMAGLPGNLWTTRWTGLLEPKYSQTYTIHTTTNDGVRLWINGNLLIDYWYFNKGTQDNYAKIPLIAGRRYTIKMEYCHVFSGAIAQLRWSCPSQPDQIIPQTQLYSIAPNVPPAVGIAAPISGTGFSAPANIPITVVSSDSDGTVTSVQIFANGVLIGQAPPGSNTMMWNNVAAGTYVLTAQATDNSGAITISSPVTITIK